jgi:hypothetical protein
MDTFRITLKKHYFTSLHLLNNAFFNCICYKALNGETSVNYELETML